MTCMMFMFGTVRKEAFGEGRLWLIYPHDGTKERGYRRQRSTFDMRSSFGICLGPRQ